MHRAQNADTNALTVQPLTISQRTQTRTTAGQRLQTELGFGGFLVQGQVGGQYIRNRLKIAKKRRLYLDIFSWSRQGKYFGTAETVLVHGYLRFEPGAWK